MARIVFIEHEADCPPAWVGDWAADAGAEIVVIRPYLGDSIGDLADADGVVILGGEMGANDDVTVPWLPRVKELVRDLSGRGVPALGICLGHQLMAAALGGKVAPDVAGQVTGLVEVGRTDAGESDPVLGAVPSRARAAFWNRDVVQVLPHGATLLAVSADERPQAIRYGEAMWGVQFHPEVDAAILELWVEDGHRDRDLLLARIDEIRSAEPELVETWRPMVQAFVGVVAGGPS